MMSSIWAILAPYAAPIIAALAGLLGLWGYGAAKKREGVQKAKSEAVIEDYEHAESIRKRVAGDRADRLRRFDDAGYRD